MTIEQRMLRDYGTTDDPYLAVWLTKDGTMANGSYEGRQRNIDHHEINAYFKKSARDDPSELNTGHLYIRKFMRRGNIRMGCSEYAICFELMARPTPEQLQVVVPLLRAAILANVETCVCRHGESAVIYETAKAFFRYLERYLHIDPWTIRPKPRSGIQRV